MTREPTVFVVDDDPAVLDSLRMLIESVGLRVQTAPSAQAFLSSYDPDRPGCLVLDVRMPEMSGLELQQRLASQGVRLPILIVTGHGNVPTAVKAFKAGAMDFFEKPYDDQALLDSIQEAIAVDARRRATARDRADLAERFGRLTARENEVLQLVVGGKPNRVIALELRISEKTVEAHRARIMEKSGAISLAELVQLYLRWKGSPEEGEEDT
jgi:two-component system response regulator FixJ